MGSTGIFGLIATVGSGIAAGVLVTVLAVLTPLVGKLGPGPGLRMKNMQDALIDRVNPPCVVGSILAGILLLIFGDLTTGATVLAIVGIAGMIGVGILSFGFNFPLNRVMAKMSPDDVPPEFEPAFRRWIRYHIVRTALGLAGFVGYAASLAVLAS
jgi:uncharacterized membrane protein